MFRIDPAAPLIVHCRNILGRTKQPKEIRFIATLPRSDAGKVFAAHMA